MTPDRSVAPDRRPATRAVGPTTEGDGDSGLQQLFVAMVSHEFRTPLAIIDAAAQNIDLLDGCNARPVGSIRMAVQRLLHMIDVCLTEDRTGSVAMRPRPQTCDLRALLSEAVAGAGLAAGNRRIDLQAPGRGLAIHADPQLLRVAVDNLLENAVKYSPDGSTITVTARRLRDGAQLAVEDEGTGIRAADRKAIFEKYRRSNNTAGIPGAGVGLYLVREILAAHGGLVRVGRRRTGGSRFVLRIPGPRRGLSGPAA